MLQIFSRNPGDQQKKEEVMRAGQTIVFTHNTFLPEIESCIQDAQQTLCGPIDRLFKKRTLLENQSAPSLQHLETIKELAGQKVQAAQTLQEKVIKVLSSFRVEEQSNTW